MYGKADVQEQQNYLLLMVLTTVVTACSVGDTVQNMMDHSQGGPLIQRTMPFHTSYSEWSCYFCGGS